MNETFTLPQTSAHPRAVVSEEANEHCLPLLHDMHPTFKRLTLDQQSDLDKLTSRPESHFLHKAGDCWKITLDGFGDFETRDQAVDVLDAHIDYLLTARGEWARYDNASEGVRSVWAMISTNLGAPVANRCVNERTIYGIIAGLRAFRPHSSIACQAMRDAGVTPSHA